MWFFGRRSLFFQLFLCGTESRNPGRLWGIIDYLVPIIGLFLNPVKFQEKSPGLGERSIRSLPRWLVTLAPWGLRFQFKLTVQRMGTGPLWPFGIYGPGS